MMISDVGTHPSIQRFQSVLSRDFSYGFVTRSLSVSP